MDGGIIITEGPSSSFLHLLEALPSPSVRLTQVVASSLGMRSSQLPSHLVYFIPSQPRLSLGIPRNPYTWLFLGREIFLPQLIHHPAHKLLLPQQARGALLAVPPKNSTEISSQNLLAAAFLPRSTAGAATAPGGRDTTFHHLGFPPAPAVLEPLCQWCLIN